MSYTPYQTPVLNDSVPERPGFYWARWMSAELGTRDGDIITPDAAWLVVQVFENAEVGRPDHLLVLVPGVEVGQALVNFEWGSGLIAMIDR